MRPKCHAVLGRPDIRIGAPVRVHKVLRRGKYRRGLRSPVVDVRWKGEPLRFPQEGIIIGAQYVFEGKIEENNWEPSAWFPSKGILALKIATGWMNRPLLATPDMLEPLDAPPVFPALKCNWPPGEIEGRRRVGFPPHFFRPRRRPSSQEDGDMIEEQKDTESWVVTCDRCGDDAEFDAYGLDFHGLVAKIKSLGWRIRKTDDGWTHTCPDCLEEERHAGAF